MAYQALYRQWRPQSFSAMVGQEAVLTTLRNQVISGRIAHAYLFCGSRGTGKTSTAKIMARAINCLHPENGDPCGECESCRRLSGEGSLDVLEIDAASNNGVDEIRDLRETVKYPPQYGKYKVYIIDEVHMLSGAAFNALLKTLEEPAEHVVFILATTEPQRLPATILSRCQRFDFGRIPAQQIAQRLRRAVEGAGATAEESALRRIARAAEGGMRDALSMLDMCLGYQSDVTEELVRRLLGTSDRAFLFRFSDALRDSDIPSVMTLIDELMRGGHEPLTFAKEVSRHLRALLLSKSCGKDLAALMETTEEDAAEYREKAEDFSDARLLRLLELFMAVETDLRWASSPRIALEAAAAKACLKTADTDAAALEERMAELEKRLEALTKRLRSGAYAQDAQSEKLVMHAVQSVPPVPEKTPVVPSAALSSAEKRPEEVWKAMMNALKRSEPATYSFLTMGRFGDCEGNVFHWYAKAGQEFYAGLLNGDVKRKIIADALTQAMGAEVRFEARAERVETPAVQEDEEKTLLSELKKTLGGENVIVQEK